MTISSPIMIPAPGERQTGFQGDVLTFRLRAGPDLTPDAGCCARLRTTLGRGRQLREEIHQAHFKKLPVAGAAWRDVEMQWGGEEWVVSLPLAEVGFFRAKAYVTDANGWQHWPDGPDFGISVLPDWCRTANTIYCAFPRMFGPNKPGVQTLNEAQELAWRKLDEQGYTLIPPSGKIRDLIRELPHILDRLGCRILHLLPVGPTPTTMAKFGRYGSPYAVQDLTGIDPALVDFDRRTTGVEQFCELARVVHRNGARLLLDVVINHTGWGSTLFENHPEWFVRHAGGEFVSPGAWGTVWEDLVEIDPACTALWDELAEAFLIWCRRGVDGFRCDAGYKVPVLVWQYITARVHDEYPETVFLLEGLGGGWDDTVLRLTDGGMQWAYSELFQNYSAAELCGYLDHAWKESRRVGLLVHYSETHDNERLAAKGRKWALLRNQLCALASVNGGFGFTNGVEWLAPERVNVHSARGLAWGAEPNIIGELSTLNRLLSNHPCFFDGSTQLRLSTPADKVFAFARFSAETNDVLLVIANADLKREQTFKWTRAFTKTGEGADRLGTLWERMADEGTLDLLTKKPVKAARVTAGQLEWSLEPGQVVCLQPAASPDKESGREYREWRARAAFATQCALAAGREDVCVGRDGRELARRVDDDPCGFLAGLMVAGGEALRPVICWTPIDQRRITPVPPRHWVLVKLPHRFRLSLSGGGIRRPVNLSALLAGGEWIAAIPPGQPPGDADLKAELYGDPVSHVQGTIRFLAPGPVWNDTLEGIEVISRVAAGRTVLLTNGRGGMARLNLDLGRVRSKYDCVLGANLDPELPVDRHIFVKRVRVWANANGFISPLNADSLVRFELGSPAVWRFRVAAGDGQAVFVKIRVEMTAGENEVVIQCLRERSECRKQVRLRLTVRFDIEDRNFHWETQRNAGADHHFNRHTRTLAGQVGFEFAPAADRILQVVANAGDYHEAPEWSEHLPHPVESGRGQTGEGDGWSPGWFDLPLDADGAAAQLVVKAGRLTAFPEVRLNPEAGGPEGRSFERQLHAAASQFIVRRGGFKSVIAGYPWFLDWGRDTLICARGLIAGGWLEEVRQLLVVFGRFEEHGTLPNTIHGADASNRDTSDAPLWFGVVAEELAAATDDSVFELKVDDRRTVRDVLGSIALGFLNGTSNGIKVDPGSGLVWSPGHFTWMDTNFPAGTPREGYPIEIQSLWIRLLCLLERLNLPAPSERWGSRAECARASLAGRYWIEGKGWFADSLIARPGVGALQAVPDQVLRSNCLIPISFGQIAGDSARRCVEAARQYLVVPGALRTLAPLPAEPPLPVYGNHGGLLNDPANPYWGSYEGDEDTRRKPAYHNGTAWTWTFPIFCEALVRAHGESAPAVAAARAYLGSMDRLLEEGCFGQLPEIVDGDAPHCQRGCDAQAWGGTEALRVWRWLQRFPPG